LPFAEFLYNATYHSSLGASPFKALYGCEPNLGALPMLEEDNLTEASLMLRDRQAHLEQLKVHLANT
jgi:hypothetical protein